MYKYPFPVGITLDETRAAVAAHNERIGTPAFIEADRGDYVIFNYVVSFNGAFPYPNTGDVALDRELAIIRECRGLTFHKDGRVLARKFAKFFNVGEKPESQLDVVDWSEPHRVLEKMDGSMINAIWLGEGEAQADGLIWCTKMGETDVAKPVKEWVKARPKYAEWTASMINHGWTPLFEWCSRKQKIVIDYPQDRLVLLAMRDNATGHYMPFDQMRDHAITGGIDFVRALPGSLESIEEFMAEVHDVEGMEGYIIRFDDGRMYKVKGLWYCQIHKTKDVLQHEKDVLALLAHDLVDDVKPFMDPADLERVEAYQNAYEAAVAATAADWANIVSRLSEQSGGDQKVFAGLILKDHGPASKSLFQIKQGQDALSVVKSVISKAVHPTAGTAARVDSIRHLLGGLSWDDYKFNGLSTGDE